MLTIKKKRLVLLIYTLHIPTLKLAKVCITQKFSVLHKAVFFANMFHPNLISFYLCLVAVPQIAWSARVNTTASGGKVIISGNHNEVVVSTDRRDNRISLAKIKSGLESVKKSNAELFYHVQNNSQRLSALESQGTLFRVRWRINAYSVSNSFCIIVFVQANFTIRLFSGRICYLWIYHSV